MNKSFNVPDDVCSDVPADSRTASTAGTGLDSVGGIEFDPALNRARQICYRFAALTLLDPRADCWQPLSALREDELLFEAAALVRSEPAAQAHPLGFAERPLSDLDPAAVLQRLPESPAAMHDAYQRTFGLLVSNACPPYETEYINGKFTFQRSQTLGDIGGFYRAFGLQPSRAHPERHDHIVLELEFMALLLSLHRRAAQRGGPQDGQRVAVCSSAQVRFLREHLAWWAPAFAKLLAKEDAGGFYEAAGVLLAALVGAERALLGVESPHGEVTPGTLERPEQCEGCGLNVLE